MNRQLSRRGLLGALALFVPVPARAQDWASLAASARGESVFFNAWGGSDAINAYIAWSGEQVKQRFGVALVHVKLADTSEAVRRVRDEVAAGVKEGSVDLLWINGENFRTMKKGGLLFGPFAEGLPNFRYVDTQGKPTTLVDFAEPVEGLEAPWGMAQLTFFGDATRLASRPQSMDDLASLAKANPGRLTYPAPPDFHGTTFLKQILLETSSGSAELGRETTPEAVAALTEPLWEFLERLHPHLWRGGKQFPANQAQLTQMMADGELLVSFTFNPNEPANLIAQGRLPSTTVSWQHKGGTIGNTHFLAIPVNARAKAGAQVVANFLLSPEAQAHKADLAVWGDPTVLAIENLSEAERRLFVSRTLPGAVVAPAPALPEPHASWVPLIERGWLERFGG